MMNRDKTYLCGNTIRLIGEFFDFQGNPRDIALAKLTIYDYKYQIVHEVTLTNANKNGVGRYFYDYNTPITPSRFIYEFKGEVDGMVALDRKSFVTKFIK